MADMLNMKAGDKVIYYNGLNEPCVETIERVTPTGRAVVRGNYFMSSGKMFGGFDRISEYSEEAITKIEERKKNRATVDEAFYLMETTKKITLTQAKAIVSILKK